MTISLLGVKINLKTKVNILEQIKKYIAHPAENLRISSINPEILVIAKANKEFRRIIEISQIQHVDGIGVVLAAISLGFQVERIAGVDLMLELVKMADKLSLRVLLIGG